MISRLLKGLTVQLLVNKNSIFFVLMLTFFFMSFRFPDFLFFRPCYFILFRNVFFSAFQFPLLKQKGKLFEKMEGYYVQDVLVRDGESDGQHLSYNFFFYSPIFEAYSIKDTSFSYLFIIQLRELGLQTPIINVVYFVNLAPPLPSPSFNKVLLLFISP